MIGTAPRPRPLSRAETSARYYERHRGRSRARVYARRALQRGKIAPPPTICPKCGNTPRPRADGRRGMEMHHHRGYDHPLDIQWLCWTCHSAERRGTKQPSPHVRGVILVTRCKNGHEYSEANTYWNLGRRYCHACRNDREKARSLVRVRRQSDTGDTNG